MKKILLLALLVVLGGGGYCGYRLMKTKGELKPEVARLLERMRDGQAEAVYAEASGQLRSATTAAEFRRYFELREAALGKLQGLGDVKNLGHSVGKETTGELDVEVRFEKETVTGEFEFVKEDGRWKLLGMKLPVPEGRLPTIDAGEAERRVRSLIDLYNEGNAEAFHATFDAALAAKLPFDQFGPRFAGLRSAGGRITDVKVTESKTLPTGTRRIELGLTFEGGPGSGYFELLVVGDKWTVIGFNLDKPAAAEVPPAPAEAPAVR